MDETHRVGGARPEPSRVVVEEELRLVRRHVHVDGALALASLAREAEIERLLHCLALPSVLERRAFEHLEQQVRPASRRVHLFPGRAIARTHGAAALLAALA